MTAAPPSAKPAAGKSSPARASRREAVREFKRAAILDAAKTVFYEHGLEGASMRGIAAAAGYTVGALYGYYPGKEHIYADILADSLAALGKAVREAASSEGDAKARARAAANAFYTYYRVHPQELDLSLYLYQGIGPRGLTPALDRQLNGRLIAVLKAISDAIEGIGGVAPASANEETVAAACHMSGVLLMERSGRLKVLGYEPQALVARYLDTMIARLAA